MLDGTASGIGYPGCATKVVAVLPVDGVLGVLLKGTWEIKLVGHNTVGRGSVHCRLFGRQKRTGNDRVADIEERTVPYAAC